MEIEGKKAEEITDVMCYSNWYLAVMVQTIGFNPNEVVLYQFSCKDNLQKKMESQTLGPKISYSDDSAYYLLPGKEYPLQQL